MDQRCRDGHNTRQVNERKENIKSRYDKKKWAIPHRSCELQVTCVIAYYVEVMNVTRSTAVVMVVAVVLWMLYFFTVPC